MLKASRAQVLAEYMILISIVAAAIMTMFTMVKRSMQNVVGLATDQIGQQVNGDQDFDAGSSGYVESSFTNTSFRSGTEKWYIPHASGRNVDERTVTNILTISNQGFTKDQ